MYKEIILSKIRDYLKLKNIKTKSAGKIIILNCPFCGGKDAGNIPPFANYLKCHLEAKEYDLLEIVKKLEPDKKSKSEEELLQYLKELLNIKVITKKDEIEIEKILNYYEKNNYALIALGKNSKEPIQEMKGWSQSEYRSKNIWQKWLGSQCNLGLRSGFVSNNTIIDIDVFTNTEADELYATKSKEEMEEIILQKIPQELKKYLNTTLTQKARRGFHLIYQYEEELPKTGFKVGKVAIDIENNGGYVVVAPSEVDGIRREINLKPMLKMPEELKKYLLSHITIPRKTQSEKIREDIKIESFNLKIIPEGARDENLTRLGGVIRKRLNPHQTTEVLHILNTHCCDPILPYKQVDKIGNSLERYTEFDESELAHRIFEYLQTTKEGAYKSEIADCIFGGKAKGENKKRLDKVLSYLMNEDKIRKSNRLYHVVKKAEWKTSLINAINPLDFKVPFLNDVAEFNYSEMVIIGGETGTGKTKLAMNIVKGIVNQGKKPYLIELEPNKRFLQDALVLGMKEGDFYYDFCEPVDIELEDNAITIIDWILPVTYAEVDKLMYHYNRQLLKTNGFLILFMQLREGEWDSDKNGWKKEPYWFAKDLVHFFSSLSCRYLLNKGADGAYSEFKIDKVNVPKFPYIKSIPCQYFKETNEVKTIEEIEGGNE